MLAQKQLYQVKGRGTQRMQRPRVFEGILYSKFSQKLILEFQPLQSHLFICIFSHVHATLYVTVGPSVGRSVRPSWC